MTLLRNNKEVSMVNRRSTRRRAPGLPPKPTNLTRKLKSKANTTGPPPNTRAGTTDLTALTRNIRYQQRVAANELATGDNADSLRKKRRWVQNEFEAGRINGKAARELHDLYAKRHIGKIEQQRAMTQALSEAAKEAKQRLEEIFKQHTGATLVAGAVGDVPGDAVTMPLPSNSQHLMALSQTNNHQALGEPSNVITSGDDPMGSEVGSETDDDDDATGGDDHVDSSDDYEDYDAAARQRVLALGLELVDYSGGNQGGWCRRGRRRRGIRG